MAASGDPLPARMINALAPICLGVEVSAAQDTDGEAALEGDANTLPGEREFWVSR
jgi:hypothetical protein